MSACHCVCLQMDAVDRSFALLRSTPDTALLVLLPALWCTRGSSTESFGNTRLSGVELNGVILIVLGLGASKFWSFKKPMGSNCRALRFQSCW